MANNNQPKKNQLLAQYVNWDGIKDPIKTVDSMLENAQNIIDACKEKDRKKQLIDQSGITMTQMRSIFGHLKRLENTPMKERDSNSKFWIEFALLKPRIKYRFNRFISNKEGKKFNIEGIKILADEIINAIIAVGNNNEKFNRFSEAFETLIAYMPRK